MRPKLVFRRLMVVCTILIGVIFFVSYQYHFFIKPPEQKAEVLKVETPPTFALTFLEEAVGSGGVKYPHTKVELVYGSKKYDVGTYVGSCSSVQKKELLPGEISGVFCWYAGSGDELRLISTDGVYRVLHRELEEGSAEYDGYRTEYEKVLEIKI